MNTSSAYLGRQISCIEFGSLPSPEQELSHRPFCVSPLPYQYVPRLKASTFLEGLSALTTRSTKIAR